MNAIGLLILMIGAFYLIGKSAGSVLEGFWNILRGCLSVSLGILLFMIVLLLIIAAIVGLVQV